MPPGRRLGWQPARSRLHEHEKQATRHAVHSLPRGRSMTRKSVAWTAALGVALVVAIALGFLVFRYRGPSDVPPAMVPASWAQFRTSLGHTTHVDSAKASCSGCHDFEREGFKNPGVAPCAKCHANEVAHAHPGDAQDKTDCLTCHT